jgi:hypothetical protein
MIFAALVAATTISVASAEDLSTQAPPPKPVTTDEQPGISPQQEAAMPYHPCVQALGWVNRRLRCDNRY